MEITKSDIEKLIETKKENNILNHFLTVLKGDFSAFGEIKQNEIIVWSQGFWSKIFYPVFTFELNSKKHLINITNKLNPIGKIIYISMIIGIIAVFIPKDYEYFNLKLDWLPLVFGIVFLIIFLALTKRSYNSEKKNQLEQIFEILDIEVEGKVAEKEWSLKNILIRLFTYPFSLFIILICFWSLFENGIKSIFMALFGIGICGMYLYSDIKIIMNNKKTTGNNAF